MDKKIFYHDTDAGGIVYYANYLNYLEESRTEFLEEIGLPIEAFHQRGLGYVVKKCTINYKSPARYGDVLSCEASLKKITAAQLIFDQRIYHKTEKRLIVEAEVILACLNADLRPVQIPADVRKLLSF